MKRAALYLHIPFCVKKCAYCDFVSYEGQSCDMARYLYALNREMDAAAAEFGALSIGSVYLGGGTPSLLSGAQVKALMDGVRRRFELSNDAECSIEANPSTVTKERLAAYREAGINRLSIGVQAVQPALLKVLERIHSEKEAREAFSWAREAGFENINLDLMYALPGQTARDWRETLDWAAALSPEHLSCYSLIVEPDTPLGVLVKSGGLSLPGEEADAAFQETAVARLRRAGYLHYEISNYALPGYECGHNLVYWRRQNYLGMGCAAHSMMDERRFQNTDSLCEYLSGTTRVASAEVPLDEQREETLMLGLRMSEGIDLSAFRAQLHDDLQASKSSELSALLNAGLVEIESDRLRLTERGMQLHNAVLLTLI